MNVNHLRSFLTVAELLNFTRAAESLHLTQSAITKQIRALEEELGTRLLVRDTHSVSLTPQGQRLKETGPEILQAIDRTKAAVLSSSGAPRCRIRIAIADYYNDSLFGFFIRYQQEHPQVHLELTHQHSWLIPEQVKNGEVDLAVAYEYAYLPDPALQALPFDRSSVCLVVNLCHKFAGRTSISMEDLAQEPNLKVDPLLLNRMPPLSGESAAAWNRILFSAVRRLEGYIPDSSAFLQIRSGESIALMPWHIARLHATGCRLLPLENLDLSLPVILFWNIQKANPAASQFIGALQNHLSTP